MMTNKKMQIIYKKIIISFNLSVGRLKYVIQGVS